MVEALHALPDLAVIGLAAVFALLCVALTGLLSSRLDPDSPQSSAALEAYKIIVTFTAILLSFCLVQANGILIATGTAVSREAGALNQLDRTLVRAHTPGADRIRPVLRAYIASVLNDDWPALRQGGGSATTGRQLGALNRAVQTLDDIGARPQLYAEMLKLLDTLNDARQERVDASTEGLPTVLWQAAGSLCTLLLALSCLIRAPGRLVAIGGHATAIAMLIALVFVVDRPFLGETSASPAPIERALAAARIRAE